MNRFLNWTSKPTTRRRLPTLQLELETLETRLVPASLGTKVALLDFGGQILNPVQMNQGGWTGVDHASVDSFSNLFTADRPSLDMNGDGAVNGTDATLAINRIVAQVSADFAPYDLQITVGNFDDHAGILTDARVGDVVVFVSGCDLFSAYGSSYDGVAPYTDLGNEHDDIVWVSGFNTSRLYSSDIQSVRAAKIVNELAFAIGQEMGHAFGLDHILVDPTGNTDAGTHHIMGGYSSGMPLDFNHDFNFQDRTYQTDHGAYTFKPSANHPEFDTNLQNAHQIFSNPDVLGPSTHSWMAVLSPGELTIVGDDAGNTITVNPIRLVGNYPAGTSAWQISADATSTVVYVNNPSLSSPNPFDQPLAVIRVKGRGGNDTITVNWAITAKLIAYGGMGNDTITGGAGNDVIYGGDGPLLASRTSSTSKLGATVLTLANDGDDILKGGAGSDYLYGGTGNDRLFGQGDVDYLFGEAGDDWLDGGDDGYHDYLTGGSGIDTFVRHNPLMFAQDAFVLDMDSFDLTYLDVKKI